MRGTHCVIHISVESNQHPGMGDSQYLALFGQNLGCHSWGLLLASSGKRPGVPL